MPKSKFSLCFGLEINRTQYVSVVGVFRVGKFRGWCGCCANSEPKMIVLLAGPWKTNATASKERACLHRRGVNCRSTALRGGPAALTLCGCSGGRKGRCAAFQEVRSRSAAPSETRTTKRVSLIAFELGFIQREPRRSELRSAQGRPTHNNFPVGHGPRSVTAHPSPVTNEGRLIAHERPFPEVMCHHSSAGTA